MLKIFIFYSYKNHCILHGQFFIMYCCFLLLGLTAEGIYRIPGNKAQVDLLTAKYTEGMETVTTMELLYNMSQETPKHML